MYEWFNAFCNSDVPRTPPMGTYQTENDVTKTSGDVNNYISQAYNTFDRLYGKILQVNMWN